jgi:ribonuclease P protein component
MKDIHAGKIDLVACWKMDRLARSVRHLINTLDEFRARNVEFYSARDAIDTSTPAGRFSFAVIAAVAELERELIRERTKAGIAAARRCVRARRNDGHRPRIRSHRRLGVTASRKALGNAVQRNRARRLLKETFRLRRSSLDNLWQRYDWVINAKRDLPSRKVTAAIEEFEQVISKVAKAESKQRE